MLDQNAFRETLHLVQEVAAASAEPMTREEALSYFQDMELSEEQKELVYRFLQRPPEQEKEADVTGADAGQADVTGEIETGEVEKNASSNAKKSFSGQKKSAGENCTAHFQMYMREVSGISRLQQDQEQQLYQRLLAGDKSVIEEISHQWLSRIVAMAREYQNESYYLDDLVQEGNIALLTALHEFAGRQEAQELEKKLVEAVMDAIEAFMGLESGARQQEETILAKVTLLHEARKFLTDQSKEEATMEALADYTRLTMEEIRDIMNLMEKAQRPS